jgi:diguanylate cyclase
MAPFSTPAEIARETLKQLMARRMAPSPENYQAIYDEIAGDRRAEVFPERELKSLTAALPRENAVQLRLARELDQAIRAQSAGEYHKALADFIAEHSADSDLNWSELVGELLRQWEARQSNLTPARKRESLDRVLATSTKHSDILFGRLQGLVKSWSRNSTEIDEIALVDGARDPLPAGSEAVVAEATPAEVAAVPASRASEILPELRELFAYALETVVASQLGDAPKLADEALAIAASVRSANSPQAVQDVVSEIKRFAFKLDFVSEDRGELRNGLLKLLQLMVENVGELVVDDRWLNGQIAMVREIVGQPMNLRTIGEAEKRLKEVIFKQSQIKHSLTEAREALKQMLAGFVDHLAEFADSTSDYHDKMERCVDKISNADDVTQLQDVLGEVIKETRVIQLTAQRSRDDLRATKRRVDEAEKRINELQNELEKASSLVRHDQLTGALNRRGLEETFDSEVARSLRRKSPLSIALLDIDNFKKLNDTLGHAAGDAALIHLVTVIRETLRPQDTLARFGGEEFLILLPDTALEDAQKALVRLQRELTRRYFLADNEKVLITFSAGVTERRPQDTRDEIVRRADEAMYAAKKAGKNRVTAS